MKKEQDNIGESSSSRVLDSQQDIEDDRMIATILSEEYASLDRSVGRRLSHLQSIPHTPRINVYIPSANEATLDHQRLHDRLTIYGLCELKIQGDGNCQFRALSDQLYHSPEYHKYVRKEVVKQFGAKICLVTSFRDTCFIEIVPKQLNQRKELWLSFWSEVHYNSLYEIGEVPIRVQKKKHWLF